MDVAHSSVSVKLEIIVRPDYANTPIAYFEKQAPQQLEPVRNYCYADVYCRRNDHGKSRPGQPVGCLGDDSILGSRCCSVAICCVRCLVTRRHLSRIVELVAASKSSHHRALFRGWNGVAVTLHIVDGHWVLGLLH